MSNQKVIQALKMLREEIPGYVEEAIMGDCPCDLGLKAPFRKWCGMEAPGAEFTSEYCERCWTEAMGEDE